MHKRNRPHTLQSLRARTVNVKHCWIWQGATRSNGYGVVTYAGAQSSPHRVAFILTYGEIPNGYEIDHACNNRACCNPKHLQLVTRAENMQLAKTRRTTCRAGHLWNEANTYTAVVKYKSGSREQRYCRVCRKEYQRLFRKQ